VKSKIALFLLLALLVPAGCGVRNNAKIESGLEKLVAARWRDYGAGKQNWGGGVALFLITPQGSFFTSTGLENFGFNTHFRGASTTKTFTAAAIMLLAQRGQLKVDDTIGSLIPGSTEAYVPRTGDYFLPHKKEITIRQLLGHKAGVFDITNNVIPADVYANYAGMSYFDWVRVDEGQNDHTFTFDELVGVVAKHRLSDFPPGERFHYSNTGYDILGKIIERVSGKRYDQFVKDEFLTPNGLSDTSFPYLGTEQTLPVPFLTGYTWINKTFAETTVDNMSGNVAEGNVITTPFDLTTWIKKWIKGEAGLSPSTVKQMMDVKATGESHKYYGLGCNYTPGLGYGHNGGHMGYMTVVRYDPRQDVTIFLLSNCLNGSDINGQLDFLYDLAYSAKELAGYPTAEASKP
jgi:D-alanyl-D-alanine carboxypeptidase